MSAQGIHLLFTYTMLLQLLSLIRVNHYIILYYYVLPVSLHISGLRPNNTSDSGKYARKCDILHLKILGYVCY